MRILLVGEESKATGYLRQGLLQNGFAVDLARERPAFPRQIPDYDLFVCDGVPGSAQLTEWRRAGQQAPVLIVTARESFLDFLNRVRSLLRAGDTGPETLHAAGLELDAIRHRASRDGRRLDLTPKEFLLLSLLMRHAGEVLSRALIAEQIWDINFAGSTNFVDVHIRRLRSKVDDPFDKKLIHTVRGVGYVFEEW